MQKLKDGMRKETNQAEEKLISLITLSMDETKAYMYSGCGGSKSARQKARVASVELAKLLKEYRKETVR